MFESMLRERFIDINNKLTFDLNLDTDFTEQGNLKQEKLTQLEQLQLHRQGNVSIQFLAFLAYKYEHNYIVLEYQNLSYSGDVNTKCTYLNLNYYEYYIYKPYGEERKENHIILFNNQTHEKYKSNTSILFNDGHYVLFQNPSKYIEEDLIQEFIYHGAEKLWKQNYAFDTFDITRVIAKQLQNTRASIYRFIRGNKASKLIKRKQKQRHTLRRKQLKRHTLRRKQLKRQTVKNRK
jgi:hypothetical protein